MCRCRFGVIQIILLVLSCLLVLQAVYTFVFGLVGALQSLIPTYLLSYWVYGIGATQAAAGLLGIVVAVLGMYRKGGARVLCIPHVILATLTVGAIIGGYVHSILVWVSIYQACESNPQSCQGLPDPTAVFIQLGVTAVVMTAFAVVYMIFSICFSVKSCKGDDDSLLGHRVSSGYAPDSRTNYAPAAPYVEMQDEKSGGYY